MHKAERALRALSECNRVLVRATNESQLLQEVCAILVGVGGYHFAWVGYAEHDEGKTVRPVAHAGYENGHLANAQIVWSDTELGQRPSGTAIRTGKPCVVQDVHADTRFVAWSAQARTRGFESSAALPLKLGDQVQGALVIHAEEPDAFDEEEMALLAELSEDVAFGVQALRTQAERREAEFALRDSEARFRFLFVGNPLPMWVYDLETLAFLEVNDAAVAHYGYSREDFLKMRITDIRPPEEAHRLRKNLAQARQALEDSGPWRHRLKNGQIILAQITSHLLPWNGRAAALEVAQDITERARAELALRESEERYRLLFENNLAGVFRTDVDGNILDCNLAMADMLGASSPREVLTHNVLDFYFSDEDRTKFRADLELAGRVTDYELRLRRKDGSALWVIANVNARVQAGGGAPIIEGTLVNISDRKRAERSLRESEERFRATFENAGIGMALVDMQGHPFKSNPMLRQMLGYSEDELSRTASPTGTFA